MEEVLDAHLQSTLPTEYEVTPQTTSSLANGARAAWLYETYLPTTTTQEKAAALQLALWDVVYDNGDGLTTGIFRYVDGLTVTGSDLAASLISSSEGQSGQTGYYQAVGPCGQSMIGPVPEANAFLLLGLGLAMFTAGLIVRQRA